MLVLQADTFLLSYDGICCWLEDKYRQQVYMPLLLVMTVLRRYRGSLMEARDIVADRLASHLSCKECIGPLIQDECDSGVPPLLVHDFS